ncbi:MAG TPA: hypothetical protein VK439_15120 [Rubrivivax sp.]|nr:hypothetical protein [Rubrivivax sp.]
MSTTPKKTTALRDAVNHLTDAKLEQLIIGLKFSIRLEQATLHHAQAEQRRRRRVVKKAAIAL